MSSVCVQSISKQRSNHFTLLPLHVHSYRTHTDTLFTLHLQYDQHYMYHNYRYWSSPLASALPYAPDMKIWCLYGANQNAERGYLYKASPYLDEADNKTANELSVPYTIHNSAST
jgi:Lecithin:cholesterol acyltransferase